MPGQTLPQQIRVAKKGGVAEQFAKKLLNSEEIRIGQVRVVLPIIASAQISAQVNTSESDRRAARHRCVEVSPKARDHSAPGESVIHIVGSGRCPVFKAELEKKHD